jgi:nitroreductase/NAD-dependent dihydropyrimidine dehydrogenase PreA subunit
MELIKVDQLLCVKCGICVRICPTKTLAMGEDGPIASSPQACIACGHCVAVCPHSAIDNIKSPLSRQIDLEKFPVINAETAEQFLRSRRSIRCYKKESVPRDLLSKLLDIGRFAQTASNKQGISYIVVGDKETLKKATEATIQWMEENLSYWWSFPIHIRAYRDHGIDGILHDAPNLMVATAQKGFKNGRENTILSFSYIELFANSVGLGTAWVGLIEMCAFSNYRPLLDLFKIPDDKVFTGAAMVGYPKYRFKRLVDRNPIDVTYL